MKKFFNVIAVVCAFLIAGFVSCKAPSSGGGNGGGNGSGIKSNPVTTDVTVANIAEVIAGLTDDSTIVMSGEVKPSDISSIVSSISQCSHKINLDLSNVTGLTEIPDEGFLECEKLCGITLPDTVTAIGSYAFCCTAFTEIKIPSSVKTIGNSAFEGSLNLTKINVDSNNKNYCDVDGVLFNKDKTELIDFPGGKDGSYTIPDSVKTIGQYAFYGRDMLTEIIIPDSVKTIDVWAFMNCWNLEKVTIGKSVETIGEYSFNRCVKLTEITIPDSVKTISAAAFAECTNLEKVTIGKSVETIGAYAFEGCGSLESINVDINNANYSSVNGDLFNKDKTFLIKVCGTKNGAYSIPDTVKEIESYAFVDCRNLEKVTIGKSVETIWDNAFWGCEKLNNITIPQSVEWIGYDVFALCKKLTSITFEDPSGWYVVSSYYAWENKIGRTSVNFSDPVANVSIFKSADISSRFFKLTSE